MSDATCYNATLVDLFDAIRLGGARTRLVSATAGMVKQGCASGRSDFGSFDFCVNPETVAVDAVWRAHDGETWDLEAKGIEVRPGADGAVVGVGEIRVNNAWLAGRLTVTGGLRDGFTLTFSAKLLSFSFMTSGGHR